MLRVATAKTLISTAGSSDKRRRRSPEHGFSLLEIIVALVIAGLLLAVIVPSLAGALEQAKLKATARTLAATLRLARERAIAQGGNAVVLVDVAKRRYGLEGSGHSRLIADGIHITVVAAGAERSGRSAIGIRFFPDGTATGGRITLARGSQHYDVDVDWLTGRVRIED